VAILFFYLCNLSVKSNIMVSLKNVSFSYDGKHRIAFPDFEVEQGNTMLLLGQSGVGKTTLLHLLAGLMKPTDGELCIADTQIQEISSAQMDKFRGENIGIVFQRTHFIESLNAIENIELAQRLSGNKVIRGECMELLDRLGIKAKAQSLPRNMSQGEKQRLAIARAIINRPRVILADEPTSALDDHHCDAVYRLLTENARKSNSTLIIVTHDGRLKELLPNQVVLN
jgi:ABC-type lipoprotein export system ATPase subunit